MESKKYGLTTAIAMIVGIVIGSGIFFKSDNISPSIKSGLVEILIPLTSPDFTYLYAVSKRESIYFLSIAVNEPPKKAIS